jgi:hypothetical protein
MGLARNTIEARANRLIGRRGIDFDSSILIDAERRGQNARQTLSTASTQ